MMRYMIAAGIVLYASQPACATVTLALTSAQNSAVTTGTLQATGAVGSGNSRSSGSGSIKGGQLSSSASGDGARAENSLWAQFSYAVAGADDDSITDVTFSFESINGAQGKASATSSFAIYDDGKQLFSYMMDGSETKSVTYGLHGTAGSLVINLNAASYGATSRVSGPYGFDYTIPADNVLKMTLTKPDSVGYVLRSANPIATVPEPATWGMMVLGFGIVGAATRRRRPVADRVSVPAGMYAPISA